MFIKIQLYYINYDYYIDFILKIYKKLNLISTFFKKYEILDIKNKIKSLIKKLLKLLYISLNIDFYRFKVI